MSAEPRDIPTPEWNGIEYLRAALTSKDICDALVAKIRKGLDPGCDSVSLERTAMNLVARAAKITGADVEIGQFIVNQIGASSEVEARNAVRSVREVAGWSTRTKVEEMARELIRIVRAEPELREVAVRELGALASRAEVVE